MLFELRRNRSPSSLAAPVSRLLARSAPTPAPAFREPVRARASAPGEASLHARVVPPPGDEQVLVHWEVARDPHFRRPECYGLRFAGAASDYQVSIDLHGLEPGQLYWFRLCAHGSWSAVGQLRTSSYASLAAQCTELVSEPARASASSA